jgi:pyruvate-formate lyase-activating enzyme
MSRHITPHLVFADASGRIYDHPDLLMLTRRGDELALPRPGEVMPLPPESELFVLPGRRAVGLDPETGEAEALEEQAVAAFVCPGHTATGVVAFHKDQDAPVLPMFSYAAVGFAEGRLWVCTKKVDEDRRQVFAGIPRERIAKGAQRLLAAYPKNRLMAHLANCALTYCCPAARNLALGRYEAPLPTARTCNARCLGCLSAQPEDSGFPATQQRIAFAPDAKEIVQVMAEHCLREKRPILSFGQGCEGEPLTEAATIAEAVAAFRAAGGQGAVNVNTNASLPEGVDRIARAGADSIRVSLVSARPGLYADYYRPRGYGFSDVVESIRTAKADGLWVSLNLIFFPGVTDTEEELAALSDLVGSHKVDFIQLRNLNLDPDLYLALAANHPGGPAMGLQHFRKRLRKACPWLEYGYFNPYLRDGKKI